MPLSDFDIDFKKKVSQLVGNLLRRPVRVAWLTAVLKPLRTIHDLFLSYTSEKVDEIKWNGQTIKLEKLLQEKFGSGIYITNNIVETNGAFVGAGTDTQFFVGDGDDISQFIDTSYNISDVNFIVHVPAVLTFTQSEMEAWINKYKLFGTTYQIVIE